MSKWIDADALKKRVEDSNKSAGLHLEDLRKIRRWINTAPSIDIVRCAECKHASDNNVYGCMCKHFNDNDWDYHRMYADDFCSYGERKDDE